MNDINPTTGLPMSGGGIDAGGTPYGGNSSNSFDDETSQSSGDSYTILDKYWTWKVDVVLMLIAIGVNVYFWIK